MNSKPKVSVCIITYNHERFISEAIEGVLNQVTNFSFELIIGDDCSSDNTRNIVMEYAHKYPEIIQLFLPEKNLGPCLNFLNSINLCKGEYIALCDGDDYWIDPNKLKIQVDYLEYNKQCSLVHTSGFLLNGKKIVPWNEYHVMTGNVAETFYYGNIVRTSTVLMKGSFMNEFNEIAFKLESRIICDWPLFAFYATKGEFGYIEGKMSVNRINSNSVTSRRNTSSYLNYELDVVKMKRFLRDYIFYKKLDDLYSEEILLGDENHAKLKKYFKSYEYHNAKSIFNNKILNNKSLKLKKYTSNILYFYISCFVKNTFY